MYNRWYDGHRATIETIEFLKNLDKSAQVQISRTIIDIANQIKDSRKEEEGSKLSIGIERVLGLYKSINNRRWYDNNPELKRAIKIISTLPREDFLNIMEALSNSIND